MILVNKINGFITFHFIDEYNDAKFLIRTPYPVAIILISYLWFVLKIGPNYMKNRPAMNLRNLLLAYNLFQVVITLLTFLAGTRAIFQQGLWKKMCYVDTYPHLRSRLVDYSHYYFLTKVLELVETVFFVLRKNQRQVTFLHVYHHTIMVIANFCITKYSRTDATAFLGTVNSLVHVIMYTYYGLSAYPQFVKYLWWKKYITLLQLVQFCIMFIHVVVSHYISECRPAYYLVSSVCFNTVLFLFLFGDFYLKSYKKNTKSKQIVDDDKIIDSNKIASKNSINYIINHHKLAGKMN